MVVQVTDTKNIHAYGDGGDSSLCFLVDEPLDGSEVLVVLESGRSVMRVSFEPDEIRALLKAVLEKLGDG